MFFGELIEPVVELFGYILMIVGYCLGFITVKEILTVLLVSWGLSSILTMVAIVLEVSTFRRYRKVSQFIRLFILTILESVGFRQMYMIWRFQGFWRYFKQVESYY